MKLPTGVFRKHTSTLDVHMVITGGQRRLKYRFLLSKLVHLNYLESFKSIAQICS